MYPRGRHFDGNSSVFFFFFFFFLNNNFFFSNSFNQIMLTPGDNHLNGDIEADSPLNIQSESSDVDNISSPPAQMLIRADSPIDVMSGTETETSFQSPKSFDTFDREDNIQSINNKATTLLSSNDQCDPVEVTDKETIKSEDVQSSVKLNNEKEQYQSNEVDKNSSSDSSDQSVSESSLSSSRSSSWGTISKSENSSMSSSSLSVVQQHQQKQQLWEMQLALSPQKTEDCYLPVGGILYSEYLRPLKSSKQTSRMTRHSKNKKKQSSSEHKTATTDKSSSQSSLIRESVAKELISVTKASNPCPQRVRGASPRLRLPLQKDQTKYLENAADELFSQQRCIPVPPFIESRAYVKKKATTPKKPVPPKKTDATKTTLKSFIDRHYSRPIEVNAAKFDSLHKKYTEENIVKKVVDHKGVINRLYTEPVNGLKRLAARLSGKYEPSPPTASVEKKNLINVNHRLYSGPLDIQESRAKQLHRKYLPNPPSKKHLSVDSQKQSVDRMYATAVRNYKNNSTQAWAKMLKEWEKEKVPAPPMSASEVLQSVKLLTLCKSTGYIRA